MRPLFFVILSALSFCAFIESAFSQNICSTVALDDIFVFKFSGDHEIQKTQICPLPSFLESNDECGLDSPWEYSLLQDMLDLNGDKHLDLIISIMNNRWRATYPFMILINCGNDTFAKVMDGGSGSVASTKTFKNGMLELNVLSAEEIQDEIFELRKFTLTFDKKTNKYIETSVGEKFQVKGEVVLDDILTKWRKFSASIDFIKWETFPTIASFDCTKARTTTEKTICADKTLASLDTKLAYNYNYLKTLDIGSKSSQLQSDQRDWLKQRNACQEKNSCLRNAYETRIKALCSGIYSKDIASIPFCDSQ